MLKIRVLIDGSGMYPPTEYHCPSCNQLHHFYSVPLKECISCGLKFWNIRSLKDTLSCRIGYYRSAADDKDIGNGR